MTAPPAVPAGAARPARAVRLPCTLRGRHSLYALIATAVAVAGLLPGMPHAVSALALVVFVAVGPGCAVLAWLPPPPVSRMFLVPAVGLAAVIICTTAAALASWWSPHVLVAIIALATLWSVVPNLRALVHDMVP